MQKQTLIGQTFDFGLNKNRFNAVIYRSNTPSNNYLICLHGLGEVGPSDGSRINLVWRYGYPALAESGFEFPFNIIAPQVASDYYEIDKWFVHYVKNSLGASKIGVTGLSLGGRGTYSMTVYDRNKYINFIVSVCGSAQANDAFTVRDIVGQAYHGDKDTTSGVAFTTHKQFVANYNSFPGRTGNIEFVPIPNYGHNIWPLCYDPNEANYGSRIYEFITQQFNQVETPQDPIDYEAIRQAATAELKQNINIAWANFLNSFA